VRDAVLYAKVSARDEGCGRLKCRCRREAFTLMHNSIYHNDLKNSYPWTQCAHILSIAWYL